MIDATRGLIGSTIKHYRIDSLLGEGGMGVVYKAHDNVLGRTLALKVLPSRFVADPDRRARFIQEAKSASALNHPHVVTIYEIGDARLPGSGGDDGIYYIAMELVDGVTLRDKMIAGRLELKKTLEYIAEAADGLSGAHAAGVVHRDLKPENIMVSSSGYVKILDFGLAKLREGATVAEMGNSVTAIKKTDPGVVLGTVGYMSPEQAAGRPVDHRSDIFSLGCILYETVTTRRPFVGESSVDTLHKILYSEPASIRDLNPELPSDLQRILRKCLAKDPEERYQSAKDLTIDLRDLKRELESQPQLSGAIAAPQVRRPASAWMWFGVAGLVVIAIALAAIFLHHRAGGARAAPTAPMKITRITTSGLVIAAAISPDANYVAYVHSDAGQHGLWLR